MGIGIFKKMKNAFKSVGSKIGNIAKNVVKALPKVVETGRNILDKVKPVAGLIPGVGNVINAIDTGLNVADKAGRIGRSLINEVT